MAYPNSFTPIYDTKDVTTVKKIRCEIPNPPINTSLNIPSHITAMYKKVMNYIIA